MGIAFALVKRMEQLKLLARGCSILDIGSSNLYSATAGQIGAFVRTHAPDGGGDVEAFAARLAAGSAYDPIKGGVNGSFVGELFERAGMRYVSIDIANGYRTRILDLNHAPLPVEFQHEFDLVLNFGTTEHVLNQLNCFKVIHDAAKAGGYMFHSLPAVGFLDHGYLTYTGRCFFDVAGNNEYEIADLWFEETASRDSIFDSLKSYSAYFPVLRTVLERYGASEQGRALGKLYIPDIAINVIYRKVKNKPFWGALESSTSVGAIPDGISAAYRGGEQSAIGAASRWTNGISGVSPFKNRIAAALQGHPRLFRIARRAYRLMRSS